MANEPDAWDAATWEGSRRAQLRRALKLTVRQRLEALEALSTTSRRLAGAAKHARAAKPARAAQRQRDDEHAAGS